MAKFKKYKAAAYDQLPNLMRSVESDSKSICSGFWEFRERIEKIKENPNFFLHASEKEIVGFLDTSLYFHLHFKWIAKHAEKIENSLRSIDAHFYLLELPLQLLIADFHFFDRITNPEKTLKVGEESLP